MTTEQRHRTFTPEHCFKISMSLKGRKPTDETRQKMSDAQKASPRAIEHLRKITEALRGSKYNLGHHPTLETRQKMSKAHKGKKLPPFSIEHRQRISAAKTGKRHPHLGHPHSLETRRKIGEISKGRRYPFRKKPSLEIRLKMSKSRKGKKFLPEFGQKMSEILRGKPFTAEHCQHIREGKTGTTLTQKHRQNIAEGNKGKHHTLESRQKMSRMHKGIIFTLEHRKRISEANKGTKLTLETRKKMSKARKGKPFTLEHCKKISESLRIRWQGHIPCTPYSLAWTKRLRLHIRARDNCTCQVCSLSQSDKTHDVHHIDYVKTNCEYPNLITLCHKCHIKTNTRREYWTRYFQAFMITREQTNLAPVEVEVQLVQRSHNDQN